MRTRRFAFGAVSLMAALVAGILFFAGTGNAGTHAVVAAQPTAPNVPGPTGPVQAPTAVPTNNEPTQTGAPPTAPTQTSTESPTSAPTSPESPTGSPTTSPSPSESPSASPSPTGSPSPGAGVVPPGVPTDCGTQPLVQTGTIDGKQVLVDCNNRALYRFTGDSGSTSTCTGECATAWPPLTGHARAGSGVDASQLSTSTNPDGATQVTYFGHPLYYFTNDDHKPLTATGQGIAGQFFLVDPQGNTVK